MPKKRYTPEEIIQHLRWTVEPIHRQAKAWPCRDSCRKLGITEQTYYSGRRNTVGCADQAKRLKGLEQENLRLKADCRRPSAGSSILKEVARETSS